MEDKVSIIVPIYNVEKYLKSCIENIINQTYKNLEIILVNDGSTDKSLEICNNYINDNRVIIINKKNGGLSDARNFGIDASTGKYIAFLDSDDMISTDFVEVMLNALKSQNAEIACCRYVRFKEDSEITNQDECGVKTVKSKEFLKNVLYQNDQTLYSVTANAKLYKREIFIKTRYPVGKIFEDFAVIVDIASRANKIACVDKVMYFYRINNESITNEKFSERKLHILEHCYNNLEKVKEDEELEKAAECILYTRTMELLVSMKMAKYKDKQLEKKLWETIKKYRKSILKDENTRKIAKISAVLSYLGRNVVVLVNVWYKKIKFKMNIQ